jgi:hypothetical protein
MPRTSRRSAFDFAMIKNEALIVNAAKTNIEDVTVDFFRRAGNKIRNSSRRIIGGSCPAPVSTERSLRISPRYAIRQLVHRTADARNSG